MVACLLVALVVSTAPSVHPAGFGRGGRAPSVYRLEGYLDEAPEGATIYFRPIIGFGKEQRTYLITSYQRQGDGNPFDLFRNLGLYKPDFILLGPKKALSELMSAKRGSKVSGTFYYRRSTHVLEVDQHVLKIE